jgi:hypothetical protein
MVQVHDLVGKIGGVATEDVLAHMALGSIGQL